MRNYEKLSNTFGGSIYESDYEGYRSMCDIANRIASDWKFDEQCRKNCVSRDMRKAGK